MEFDVLRIRKEGAENKPIPERRTGALIATFEGGYALGWKMAVPEASRPALDILFTEKTISLGKDADGKERTLKEFQWTQGRCFDFKEGDVFWDVPDRGQPWTETLKTLKLGVQVMEARPAAWVEVKRIETDTRVRLAVTNTTVLNPKPKYLDESLALSQMKWTAGYIKFRVMRPNADRSAVEQREIIETTQERFVTFLQTGILWLMKQRPLRLFSGGVVPDFVRLEDASDDEAEEV